LGLSSALIGQQIQSSENQALNAYLVQKHVDGGFYKYGVINVQGTEIIPLEYDYITGSSDDSLIRACNFTYNLHGRNPNCEYAYSSLYSEDGNLICTGNTSHCLRAFSDNSSWMIVQNKQQKYGIIDGKTHRFIIHPVFERLDSIRNGFRVIQLKEEYGYVNEKGVIVIKPQFCFAGDFDTEGFAVVKAKEGKTCKISIINKKGELLVQPQLV